MPDDDDTVDALLAALRAETADGPPPGVWESALDAAFTAEPVVDLADLVPLMDDEAAVPDDDELVLSDHPTPPADDPSADARAGAGIGGSDDLDHGDTAIPDHPAPDHPALDDHDPDEGVDLGETDDGSW